MAYSKRRNYKRRNSKYNGRKRGPSNKALDKKIKKIQREIELKFEDTYTASDEVDDTGNLYLLNAPSAGTNVISRIGNEVKATSIQLRFSFNLPNTIVNTVHIRAILFWDRQPNGAFPAVYGASNAQTLLDAFTITDPLFAPFNYNQSERFRVLWDKTWIMTPEIQYITSGTGTPLITTVTQYLGKELFVKKKVKLSRIVKYDGSGAVDPIEDLATNSLLIAFLSDIPAANVGPNLTMGTRFYFKDA